MAVEIKLIKDGKEKKTYIGFSWTTFFFGWIVPLIRKDFIGFGIMLLLFLGDLFIKTKIPREIKIVLTGILSIIIANLYNGNYTQRLLNKGYLPLRKIDKEYLTIEKFKFEEKEIYENEPELSGRENANNILKKPIRKSRKKIFIPLSIIFLPIILGNYMVPTSSMYPSIAPRDRMYGNRITYKFSEPQRGDIVVFTDPTEKKYLSTKRFMGLPGETVEIIDERLIINDEIIPDRRYSSLGSIKGEKWIIPKKGDKIEIITNNTYEDDEREEFKKILRDSPAALQIIFPDVQFQVNGENTGMLLDIISDEEILNKLFTGKKIELISKNNYYFALGDNTDNSYDSRMYGFIPQDTIKSKIFIRFWPLNRVGKVR